MRLTIVLLPRWLSVPMQIVALLLLNATISFVEESNADKAIKALAGALAPKCKVR